VDFQQSTLAADLLTSIKPTIMSTINTIVDSSAIVSSEENTNPPVEVNKSAVTNGFSVTSSVYIDKIRYANFSDKPPTVRVVIDLKQKNGYELVEDKENHVVIIMRKVSNYTVVIDAGHGGKDTGAISINKRLEKDFNLAMVLKIQQ
jgi:N-acetylmuramoyl-L-alanine amidase